MTEEACGSAVGRGPLDDAIEQLTEVLTLRPTATCLAVRRVAEARRQRGLYP